MTSGFDELSLALFTTLSPVGVVAFILVACELLIKGTVGERAEKINRYLAVPFAVALIGFIASATHLGTPANALHVFSGIGRSPLSNEVFSAILFLFLGGSYWMLSFKEKIAERLLRAWLVVSCAAGIAFITFTSLAYSVETVPTWDTLYTPINLLFSAMLGGPILAIGTLELARASNKLGTKIFTAISTVALVVGTVVLYFHHHTLVGISNFEMSALDLAPHYLLISCMHFLLGAFAIVLIVVAYRKNLSRKTLLIVLFTATLTMCSAIFITRLAFYSLHLTVGF